ncbi:MAG: hypothetical protein M5U16_05025 [Hyphomicrobium sp.]|nr:hypothetical protein [Hyphomicrobium sp.]
MANPVIAETASEEIDKRAQNPDWWPAPGRDNKLTRHSNLKDISTENIGKLKYVWSQSTGALRGHEGQPVVVEHDGKPMMYFSSGCPNMAPVQHRAGTRPHRSGQSGAGVELRQEDRSR